MAKLTFRSENKFIFYFWIDDKNRRYIKSNFIDL